MSIGLNTIFVSISNEERLKKHTEKKIDKLIYISNTICAHIILHIKYEFNISN